MTKFIQAVFSRYAPESDTTDPEDARRARLVVAFSLLGTLFGSVFGAIYLAISHHWGAAIVAVCCALFSIVPKLLKSGMSSGRAGNHYCLILLAGFFSLCWVEGGIHGHALAWLVIVPLCALLLTRRRAAYWWSAWAFVGALLTAGVEAFGISPPIRYPMSWHAFISTLGYSSLVLFLFALGLVFENGRQSAQAKMRRTLEDLAAANDRLKKLNDEKSEFLGIAAHDLRSPLTVVMGCSEMLALDNLPPEKAHRLAASITREADRMRRLISDLLDLNAIEEGRMNIRLAPTLVSSVIDSLVENHTPRAAQKQIAIERRVDPEARAIVDEKALLQALDNLVSNAIKFTKPGGQVSLDVCADRNGVWIKVADTGPGLTPEDKLKLFGRFTRLSARPTAGESSHGLGLSIVKRLVDTMGGTIECESELGKGTAFILKFPPAPALAAPEPVLA